METNKDMQQKSSDWSPATDHAKSSDWTPSTPKVLQDYTKMEDDYGREIDRLVQEKKLTDEQFQTYTNGYCWYCGRPYSAIDGARHIRNVKFTKEERKTEGVKKITSTYSRTISIPECTDCKAFHTVDDQKNKKNGIASLIVGYIAVFAVLALITSNQVDSTLTWIICIMASLGLMTLVMLIGYIIIWPFKAVYDLITHENENNPKPILRNEGDVPQVIKARKAGFN